MGAARLIPWNNRGLRNMVISFYCQIGFVSVVLALCVTSCTVMAPLGEPERALYQWHDDFGPGEVSVHISLADQIAEFKRGDRDIGWCYVATGKEGYRTSPGNYRIMEKIVDKYSTRFGWIEDEFGNVVDGDATPGTRVPKGMVYRPSPMPYWMRLTARGIGMHGGLIPEPGQTASHGCIRMPKDFAPVVFDNVVVGTPVTITDGKSKRRLMLEHQPPQPSRPSARPPPWVGNSRVIETRPLSAFGW